MRAWSFPGAPTTTRSCTSCPATDGWAPRVGRSRTGQLAVLGPGDALTVTGSREQESRSPALDVLILGGRPIREPVAWMGPFVMNTREEVVQAFNDYQAGRLGQVPAVHNTPTTVVES